MDIPSTKHPLSRILPSRPRGRMRSPARALGWFSIALGLAELAVPRAMGRVAGAPNLPRVTRAFGLREIGTGIGIVTSKNPAPWLWGRVVGDALDVAVVGAGLVTQRRPVRTLTTLALLLGVAWLDMKVAEAAPPEKKRTRLAVRDYSGRSGFPRPADEMRGIASRSEMPKLPRAASSRPAESPPNSLVAAVTGATP